MNYSVVFDTMGRMCLISTEEEGDLLFFMCLCEQDGEEKERQGEKGV